MASWWWRGVGAVVEQGVVTERRVGGMGVVKYRSKGRCGGGSSMGAGLRERGITPTPTAITFSNAPGKTQPGSWHVSGPRVLWPLSGSELPGECVDKTGAGSTTMAAGEAQRGDPVLAHGGDRVGVMSSDTAVKPPGDAQRCMPWRLIVAYSAVTDRSSVVFGRQRRRNQAPLVLA